MKPALVLVFIFFAFGVSNISSQVSIEQTFNDTTIIADHGNIKTITTYRDGKKNGKEIFILKNGDTMQVLLYKNGKYDGEAIGFYPDHKIAEVRYFKDDNKVGEWLRFDTSGNIKTKTTFDKPFPQNEPRWSGKETFYEVNKPVYTQVWTNGRRSNIIIHNAEMYKAFKAKDISLGNKLFNEECASCHAIKIYIIGPALSEPVNSREQEWLINFIRDGEALYNSGDTAAKELYGRYNNIKHPDFTYLTKGDVDSIVSYVRQKR